jgi:imidazolonepropionase-like amidohydrolase
MHRFSGGAAAVLLLATGLAAQNRPAFSDVTRQFISVDAPVVALEHVRVIDGTGAAAAENQTIVIENGTIRSVGRTGSVSVPAGAQVMDLSGHTVIPGLVGMHDHMYYTGPSGYGHIAGAPTLYPEMGFTFPRLYLASGVTTIRTTGSVEPYTDLQLKQEIDSGYIPGPEMYVTGPYLEGAGNMSQIQMHWLTGPDDATRLVNYWADEGVTSFKAYTHITRAELAAAVKAAHARGLKITGHLCSIGFREAAELGIDDLEHGLRVDTEFDPSKQPDACPSGSDTTSTLVKLDLKGQQVQDMIHDLVQRHVAITSTLPVFENSVPGRPVQQRVLQVLSPPAVGDFLLGRLRAAQSDETPAIIFRKGEQFEHDFAKAGGLLLAGPDPTGYGGIVAGFGDQREVELLVEAGFNPLEAIHIATQNGAQYLGIANKVGTVQVGKQADLAVVRGDPSQRIDDIENVEIVFKGGVGYDSQKLIQSVQGQVGLQ